VFGDGLRQPIPREGKARLGWLLRQFRRAGRITADQLKVGEVLVRMLGADGRLDPSQATIADWADCSLATAKRALVRLRGLGFLRWQRRLRRDTGTGWRCEQTSNAYVLCPACEAQCEPPIRRFDSEKIAHQQERRVPPAPQGPTDLLERRQRQVLADQRAALTH
jgi:hypothetical protein